MTENILTELRSATPNLSNAIIRSITLEKSERTVIINLITDKTFTSADKKAAQTVLRKYVPSLFSLEVGISKLAPDCDIVKREVYSAVCNFSKTVASTLSPDDIRVERTQNGFYYTISAIKALTSGDLCDRINDLLNRSFCGEFDGEVVDSSINIDDIEVEEYVDEPEFEMPVRTFQIENFNFLQGDKILKTAVYLSDLNLVKDEVILCGRIEDIQARTYVNKNQVEKKYFVFTLTDTTATAHITYFPRQKDVEKIEKLKVGDSIVCTGVNEDFRGSLRYTAKLIDFGTVPEGFAPEKRKSKPVPRYYKVVKPQPFSDVSQGNLFANNLIPDCLKDREFVVFDLETTGLNSSPVSGVMDKIIEIGAFKIKNGEICESFTTFINPERRLSDEIVALTGIDDSMVKDAPKYTEVMPDFYKFCYGCVLVGHNIAGFDYKFIDYYMNSCGYILERKLIDTIPLSQELLFLGNYKLNTVAEKFGITFNHHRAIDDALATAKIFIELIKLKKSLPKY